METDRLIDRLAADLAPARPGLIGRRIAATAVAGGLVALAVVLFRLGLREDLMPAMRGPTFWMKAGYAAVLALAGFLCANRLARPAGSARRGVLLGAGAAALLATLGAAQMMMTPEGSRMAMWMGHSWRHCPINILALSVPTLALALWTLRGFAPTRLVAAGAAAGLFAGGVSAVAYGLSCGETAPAFVAVWYTLGVGLCTALGAALGPLTLRWR